MEDPTAPPLTGWWNWAGPPLSEALFNCESDYAYSPVVGELFNALTSLPLVAVPTLGLLLAIRQQHETRTLLPLAVLSFAGCCSLVFHVVLIHYTLVLDELPMVYGALCWLYLLLSSRKEGGLGPSVTDNHLKFGLVGTGLFTTILYYILGTYASYFLIPLIFFGIVLLSGIQCVHLMSEYKTSIDEAGLSPLLRIAFVGFMLGGLFWILDRHFCESFDFFNFHSLWQLMLAISGYLMCVYGAGCRALAMGWDANVRYWHSVLPFVELDKDPVAFTMEL
jgi:hypothetical protein